MNNSELYFAKILLFGEYSVIFNSMGLTIPYTHYSGQLSMPNDKKYTDLDFAQKSNDDLKTFAAFLKSLATEHPEKIAIDFDKLDSDLNNGLYFESGIPQGFGLGSSGAIVSAIYHQYGKNIIERSRNITKDQILRLKDTFSEMESFFHGTSSGLDPLNCYIQFPLLIKQKDDIEIVNIPRNPDDDSAIFLIDTGIPGKTEPLVNLFLSKTKDDSYRHKVEHEFIPYNNQCIDSLINGSYTEFFDALRKLSQFEFDNLKPMIPQNFHAMWKYGIESDRFHVKLCGSGGGGFLLGFTNDYQNTLKDLAQFEIKPITVYQKRNALLENKKS